jgi:hypothetical protein
MQHGSREAWDFAGTGNGEGEVRSVLQRQIDNPVGTFRRIAGLRNQFQVSYISPNERLILRCEDDAGERHAESLAQRTLAEEVLILSEENPPPLRRSIQ